MRGDMAEFEIKVHELEAGGKQYDFPITRVWLDSALSDLPAGDNPLRADAAAPEGSLSLFAEKTGEDVLVRGRLTTRLATECVRCLGPATIPVDVELVALYTARGADIRPVADADELDPDELEREFFSGDEVKLDALVREYVLLEVPMQPVCSDTCEGLEVPESVRGPADLAEAPVVEGKRVDPRLAPLLALISKESGEETTSATPPSAGSTAKKKRKGSR